MQLLKKSFVFAKYNLFISFLLTILQSFFIHFKHLNQ